MFLCAVRCSKLWIMLISTCFGISVLKNYSKPKPTNDGTAQMTVEDMLYSVAKGKKITKCEVMSSDNLPPKTFLQHKKRFDEMVMNITGGNMEGHSGDLPQQGMLYYHLARLPFVRRICEIGFNAGHSAFVWLASNTQTRVVSFDIKDHNYTGPMVSYLKKTFRNRLDMRYGYSALSVRRSVDLFHRCDLLVIDGSHSYEIAKRDLQNMRQLANMKQNLVILDDWPAVVNRDTVGKAWNEVHQKGIIKELYSCSFDKLHNYRGFTIGTYVFKNQSILPSNPKTHLSNFDIFLTDVQMLELSVPGKR